MPKIRGQNYTDKERSLLLNLIHKYSDVINSKKTDHSSIAAKNECWERINKEYNTLTDISRTVHNLRQCYFNIKRLKKKNSCDLSTVVKEEPSKRIDSPILYMQNDFEPSLYLDKQFYEGVSHTVESDNKDNRQLDESDEEIDLIVDKAVQTIHCFNDTNVEDNYSKILFEKKNRILDMTIEDKEHEIEFNKRYREKQMMLLQKEIDEKEETFRIKKEILQIELNIKRKQLKALCFE